MKRTHFEHRGHSDHHDPAMHPMHDGRMHHDPRRGMGHEGFGPAAFWAMQGFGPGGPRGRRRSRGDVRAAILSLLADGPQNGYGLMKAITDRTGGAWRASPGSVYPTLQQLVDEGLIAANGDGRGTEYALTDEGRAYVAERAEELAQAWADVPRPSESALELGASIQKLMSVVGQLRFAEEPQRKAAIAQLDETRRALYRILAD